MTTNEMLEQLTEMEDECNRLENDLLDKISIIHEKRATLEALRQKFMERAGNENKHRSERNNPILGQPSGFLSPDFHYWEE